MSSLTNSLFILLIALTQEHVSERAAWQTTFLLHSVLKYTRSDQSDDSAYSSSHS